MQRGLEGKQEWSRCREGKLETQGEGDRKGRGQVWKDRETEEGREDTEDIDRGPDAKEDRGREGECRTQMELTAGEVELFGRKAPQMLLRWLLGPRPLLSPRGS